MSHGASQRGSAQLSRAPGGCGAPIQCASLSLPFCNMGRPGTGKAGGGAQQPASCFSDTVNGCSRGPRPCDREKQPPPPPFAMHMSAHGVKSLPEPEQTWHSSIPTPSRHPMPPRRALIPPATCSTKQKPPGLHPPRPGAVLAPCLSFPNSKMGQGGASPASPGTSQRVAS